MTKDKQIEEMAKILCKNGCKDCIQTLCADWYKAEALYDAGYRKASDVAREIFEDIFYHTYYSHGRLIIEHSTLLALQKKYTEGER